jgi:serine protease AprX
MIAADSLDHTQVRIPNRQLHSAAWGGVRLLMLLLLLAGASLAFGQRFDRSFEGGRGRKFSPELAQRIERGGDTPMRVIVQYKNAPTETRLHSDEARGAKFHSRLGLVKAGVYTMRPSVMENLAQDPDVAYISPDYPVKAMDDFTDAAIGMSTVRNMGLGTSNTGIGVAVIDSGINGTPDDLMMSSYQSRVVYRQDFTGASNVNSRGQVTWDTYGHGTHVAGIIAGDGTDSNGLWTGIAYGVNLIDLRVLDSDGVGSDSNVIAAIQTAIQLKSAYNIRIINLSLGRPIYGSYVNDPVCQAVEQAWRAGIVVVVAAGNFGRVSVNGSNGYGTITSPGNDPYVITVGAMKTMNTYDASDDQIASYSSKGPTTYDHIVKPDIVAPGNLIRSVDDKYSTLYNAYPGNRARGAHWGYDYMILSGTSMATPVVSGAAAVLLEQDPTLTPDQVKARLMKTASKNFPSYSVATDPSTGQTFTAYYDLFTVGAGYLNLAAAVQNGDKAPSTVGSALSPTAVYNSSTGKVSLVYGSSSVPATSVVWGTSIVWGTSVVWGTNVNTASSVVWGTSIVWGTSSTTGFSVVWGTDTTSASSVVWGASTLPLQASSVQELGEQ